LELGIDPETCDKVGFEFLVLTGKFQVPKIEEPILEVGFWFQMKPN